MKSRTRARSVALQALYEIDVAGHPPGMVIEERVAEADLYVSLREFVRQIVLGILPMTHHLMASSPNMPEWPLDQVAIIDRNILRRSMGICCLR
jgi:N utilization substance protein B